MRLPVDVDQVVVGKNVHTGAVVLIVVDANKRIWLWRGESSVEVTGWSEIEPPVGREIT